MLRLDHSPPLLHRHHPRRLREAWCAQRRSSHHSHSDKRGKRIRHLLLLRPRAEQRELGHGKGGWRFEWEGWWSGWIGINEGLNLVEYPTTDCEFGRRRICRQVGEGRLEEPECLEMDAVNLR